MPTKKTTIEFSERQYKFAKSFGRTISEVVRNALGLLNVVRTALNASPTRKLVVIDEEDKNFKQEIIVDHLFM